MVVTMKSTKSKLLLACSVYFLALKTETVHSSKMSMNIYKTTWRYIQEGSTLLNLGKVQY
jgi:hypothetical protein